jgi:hypothetical protein
VNNAHPAVYAPALLSFSVQYTEDLQAVPEVLGTAHILTGTLHDFPQLPGEYRDSSTLLESMTVSFPIPHILPFTSSELRILSRTSEMIKVRLICD